MNASEPDITIMWDFSHDEGRAVPYETTMWAPAPGDDPVLHARQTGDLHWWPMYRRSLFPTEEDCLRDAIAGYRQTIDHSLGRIEDARDEITECEERIRQLSHQIEGLCEEITS